MNEAINIYEAQECLKAEVISDKNENIIQDIKRFIQNWPFHSESTLDLLKTDLTNLNLDIRKYFFTELNPRLEKILHCVIHNEIYDDIIRIIRERYTNEDLNFYETCKFFSSNNISPQQLGSTFYPIIPNAAVVELSVLDNHHSPMEKINCLCNTHDLVYAEVKNALIIEISKYSDKDNDIPVVNNKEALPVLMSVIAKSKPYYFVSNLFYAQFFIEDCLYENVSDIWGITNLFRDCVDNLNYLKNKPIKTLDVKPIFTNLNVCQMIDFIENNTEKNQNRSIFDEEKRRIASLIMASTSEN